MVETIVWAVTATLGLSYAFLAWRMWIGVRNPPIDSPSARLQAMAEDNAKLAMLINKKLDDYDVRISDLEISARFKQAKPEPFPFVRSKNEG